MAVDSRNLLRFLMTYGLLFLLGLGIVLFAYSPLKKHIEATQLLTSIKAKNQILGYQTPDFKQLAIDILQGHIFSANDLDTRTNNAHNLPYLPFYEKAADLFPDSFEMHYFKGVCYLWMGKSVQARESLWARHWNSILPFSGPIIILPCFI